MSKKQKRKTRKAFSEEAMKRAVCQFLFGEGGVKYSLREAAAENQLSFQTLQRYVQKEQNKQNNEKISMKSNFKHRSVFTEEEEKELVGYVMKCSEMCYGQTTKDTRVLAYEMAKIYSKKIPLTWDENQLAGQDWLRRFLKRHRELSVRQPKSRASNAHNVKLFFHKLQRAYARSLNFINGTRVFNLDETETSVTSDEHVTTCCIISASGNVLPPVMVFPGTFKRDMLIGGPPGTLGLASSSGCMNGELFTSVLSHFIIHTGSSEENPSILILDNHESHLTIVTLNMATQNGVIMVTLPPHSSHKLQPLALSIFPPFNAAVDLWPVHHPGIPLSVYNVAECVGVAFERSMTPSNIKSGFRQTGIFPLDHQIFTEDDLFVTDCNSQENIASMLEAKERNFENNQRESIPPEKDRIAMKRIENKMKTLIKTRQAPINDLFPDETDDDEDDSGVDDNSRIPELDSTRFRELAQDPVPDDFVLVEFKKDNNNIVFYIGKVLRAKNLQFEVNFLRRAKKFNGHFIFPDQADITLVELNDIKMILPPPTSLGNTKRLKSYFKFGVDFSKLNVR